MRRQTKEILTIAVVATQTESGNVKKIQLPTRTVETKHMPKDRDLGPRAPAKNREMLKERGKLRGTESDVAPLPHRGSALGPALGLVTVALELDLGLGVAAVNVRETVVEALLGKGLEIDREKEAGKGAERTAVNDLGRHMIGAASKTPETEDPDVLAAQVVIACDARNLVVRERKEPGTIRGRWL